VRLNKTEDFAQAKFKTKGKVNMSNWDYASDEDGSILEQASFNYETMSWDFPAKPYSGHPDCYSCEMMNDEREDGKKRLKVLMDMIYGKRDYDPIKFEFSLDKLCGVFGLDLESYSERMRIKPIL